MLGLLNHLHGPLATVLLCTLLFVDEVGVPLPFAPNEVLLLVGGLLLASGVLVPWLFLPLALLAMLAGMLTAFLWARTLGATASVSSPRRSTPGSRTGCWCWSATSWVTRRRR